jgi:hypothetical protein
MRLEHESALLCPDTVVLSQFFGNKLLYEFGNINIPVPFAGAAQQFCERCVKVVPGEFERGIFRQRLRALGPAWIRNHKERSIADRSLERIHGNILLLSLEKWVTCYRWSKAGKAGRCRVLLSERYSKRAALSSCLESEMKPITEIFLLWASVWMLLPANNAFQAERARMAKD